jgi:hypothetical protein
MDRLNLYHRRLLSDALSGLRVVYARRVDPCPHVAGDGTHYSSRSRLEVVMRYLSWQLFVLRDDNHLVRW